MVDLEKLQRWLMDRGAEILPPTNEYEALRFKGREVGVIYTSGKVSGNYVNHTIECFRKNKKWWGKPKSEPRKTSYQKEKKALINRDGTICFYCGLEMNDDITIEHLISLSSGGKNTYANMVLCHYECNNTVGNLPLNEKVKIAINNRIKNERIN